MLQNTWNENNTNLCEINAQVSKIYTLHYLNLRCRVWNDRMFISLKLRKSTLIPKLNIASSNIIIIRSCSFYQSVFYKTV